MSQENVEFVRNFYAMIDRGDAEAWDLLPPDFVIDLSRRLIDPVILRGSDEMRAFYRDLDAPWADGARLEVEEQIDAGDKVLVLIRFGGRGKMSGAEVEAVVWNLWTFRDGEPLRWAYYGEAPGGSLRSRRAVGVGVASLATASAAGISRAGMGAPSLWKRGRYSCEPCAPGRQPERRR